MQERWVERGTRGDRGASLSPPLTTQIVTPAHCASRHDEAAQTTLAERCAPTLARSGAASSAPSVTSDGKENETATDTTYFLHSHSGSSDFCSASAYLYVLDGSDARPRHHGISGRARCRAVQLSHASSTSSTSPTSSTFEWCLYSFSRFNRPQPRGGLERDEEEDEHQHRHRRR